MSYHAYPPSRSIALMPGCLAGTPQQRLIPTILIIADDTIVTQSLHLTSVRRWKGALGYLGYITLQVPSQGLTSGARLALARQGCATGSFKLNCAESVYAVDEQGLALFQRMDMEEDILTTTLGLREKPPRMFGSSLDTPDLRNTPLAAKTRSLHSLVDPSLRARDRLSLPSRRGFAPLVDSMSYSAMGMSSCATFTSGLFDLEDYLSLNPIDPVASNTDQASSSQRSMTLASKDVEQESSQLELDLDNSWLTSIRRHRRSLAPNSNSSISIAFSVKGLGRSFSSRKIAKHRHSVSQETTLSAHTSPSPSMGSPDTTLLITRHDSSELRNCSLFRLKQRSSFHRNADELPKGPRSGPTSLRRSTSAFATRILTTSFFT